MTKCPKCGGTEIVHGKIEGRDVLVVFAPEGLSFLAVTLRHGTPIEPESYACLGCGSVWARTDPKALTEFIARHCDKPSD